MGRRVGSELVVATGNAGKMAEFSALLAPFGCRVRGLRDFHLPEPEETEFSFAGNAGLKARAAALGSGLPSLADDSGLTIGVLGGLPGIYTADWAETGHGRDFPMAMRKTWGLIQAMSPTAPITAEFRCTLALAWPDGHQETFEGVLAGEIAWPMRGIYGHGYDPIFQPDGLLISMGEILPDDKNRMSHRAVAFRKLCDACFT